MSMDAANHWVAYDAPALRDTISHPRGNGRREMLMRVHGLHCASCVRTVEQALSPVCSSVHVNLATGVVDIGWKEDQAPVSRLFAIVEAAGYRPEPLDERPDLIQQQRERRSLLIRVGVAGVLSMQVMMLASTRYFTSQDIAPALELVMRYAQCVMATPVLLYSGWPFLRGALVDLRKLRMGMDVPIAIALLLAYAASCVNLVLGHGHVYFDSVTMFVFLLLVARWFEGQGRAEATRRLRELSAAQPLSALREREGDLEEVASSALHESDVIVVPPSSIVAADGVLLNGSAELDEALLTGESRPAIKHSDDDVYAGSINAGSAPLRIRVAATGAATMLSFINHLVHRAQEHKPKVQQLADRVAGGITIIVLLAAALGAAWWWRTSPERAFEVALAVLVITCPCALSLATPTALAAASSALARRGVLLTRPDALLTLAAIDTVCFDKTGTLTTGQMRCVRIEPAGATRAEGCLDIAAALERGIRHPIATAFFGRPSRCEVLDVEGLPGRGVRGVVDGVETALVTTIGADELTWLSLQQRGQEIARLGLSQVLRAGARDAVSELKAMNLRMAILSGDSAGAVSATAGALGIDDYHVSLQPGDKLEILQQWQADGRRVWMIGDGINDAPTLAAADVSTSPVSGSAIAQAQASLLLTNESLAGLPEVLRLAKRTRKIIRQNLAWAVLYNLIAIPLALSGCVTPWIAAAGMGVSSVVVVLNAMRLSRVGCAMPETKLMEHYA